MTATLDCMIAYLAQHPDRRQAIVDDPELMDPAIEEMLRQQTPVMMVPRDHRPGLRARRRADGRRRRRDADDRRRQRATKRSSSRPGEVMLDRGANRHLAFGGGPHRCLGSHLARMELRVALEEFHKRIPEYKIVDGIELHFSPGIRQADNLPLVFPVRRGEPLAARTTGSWTCAPTPRRRRSATRSATWLRANLPWEYGKGLPPRFDDLAEEVAFGREWQAKLASGRWVGVGWPRELGGRGGGPVEHYIVTEELARGRAPELVGRIGVNLVGPDAARARHARAAVALAPEHPRRVGDLVPAVQRARRGQRPHVALDPRRAVDAGSGPTVEAASC